MKELYGLSEGIESEPGPNYNYSRLQRPNRMSANSGTSTTPDSRTGAVCIAGLGGSRASL